MSTEATSDIPFTPDGEELRQMWQEAEDMDKKKDIRSEMYKVREARLKDMYNRGEELSDSSENRHHSSTTTKITRTSHVGGFKASDIPTHADSLADHSFLSLKSKEIRDSESPTKDAYKIVETRNLNDRDWNVLQSNETSKDGKKHTTTRIATTSGKEAVEGGELKYAAKSEQQASVFKDGDDKNFTKSTEASSRNVIKQEAHGGDDNSNFHTTSTTTTSSSKSSSEHRATSGDLTNPAKPGDRYETITRIFKEEPQFSDVRADSQLNSGAIVRKIYCENVPNELKNHPSYIDGRTKVTTETRTLPDGSTVTSTRYETVGSSTSTSSSKHVQSSTQQQQQQTSNTSVENQRFTTEENIIGGRTVPQDRVIRNDLAESINENVVKRTQDLQLLGRDSKDARNVEITITKQKLPVEEKRTVTTTVTKTINSNRDVKDLIPPDDGANTTTRTVVTKSYVAPTSQDENQTITTRTVRTNKTIGTKYDKQQEVASDFLETERQHVSQTKVIEDDVRSVDSVRTPEMRREIKEYAHVIEKQPINREPVEVDIPITTTITTTQKKSEPEYERPGRRQPIKPGKSEFDERPVEVDIPITTIITTTHKKSEPEYERPERRQPFKPGKSEFDEKPTPTEGQYDTTYRTDYVPRRISVEVSPTHDAFARSLRSISPDRISKTGSIRSLRTTSSTSLRSTNSPDRQHPNKTNRRSPSDYRPLSPVKKRPSDGAEKKGIPESPERKTTSRTVKSTDTTTRTKNIDSSTLTRRNRTNDKQRSRSASPTSIASDIEFIRHHKDIVTDLDVDDTKLSRRHTEEFNQKLLINGTPTKRPQKVTDKSATLPLTDRKPKSAVKEPTETSNDKPKSKSIRRIDTYEERCKEILGIGKDSPKTKQSPQKEPTEQDKLESLKPQGSLIKEFPAQVCKPPQTKSTEPYPDKPKSDKSIAPSVQEFPSQTRGSPQKESLGPYPDKPRADKPREPSVQEFPSQTRRAPQKESVELYPEKPKTDKSREPSVQEFPSQTRRSPQKEPLERYPNKPKADKPRESSVQEFPSQTKKLPQRETLEPYSDKPTTNKPREPSVQEFPSQTRKSPQKEPIISSPDKPKVDKLREPSVQEFPSQTRKSPQKEPLEPYPNKPKADKPREPSVQEFPTQTRRSPQKESLEPYPDKPRADKPREPSVQEFPSQTRRSPQKESVEPYPDKPKADKPREPSVQEFPSQTRRSPQKESLEPYPDKPRADKPREPSVQEFPSQTRRSPQKESLEPYPDKPRADKPREPSVQEFPSQTKRSPQKESLEPYPDKPRADKPRELSVQEFPSQTRRSPQKESLEPYPDKPRADKPREPSVQNFPSQTRRLPQKQSLEPYPDKPRTDKPREPSVQEFPSQTRRSPQKEPLEPYPNKVKADKPREPSVQEFPSQTKRSPQKESVEPYPDKPRANKPREPSVQEFPSQTRRPPQKEPLVPHSDKPRADKPREPSVQEFPSQTRRLPQKESLEPYPDKPRTDKPREPSVQEFPPQTRRSPQKEPSYPDKPRSDTPGEPSVQEFPSPTKKSPKAATRTPDSDKPKREKPSKYVREIDLDTYPNEPVLIRSSESENESDDDSLRPQHPHRVSLDDLPTIKTEKVSLDDIPTTVRKTDRPRKISLTDLHRRTDVEVVDSFVTNEKIDTEITLRKYKDESTIHRPTGIPHVSSKKKRPVKDKKNKRKYVDGEETESTTSEEEDEDIIDKVESEIIEDILVDHVDKLEERRTTQKEVTDKKRQPQERGKPKTKKAEDFITVTKTQLLQSASSKVPVEEPVHSKKFISVLCKEDEQDRMTQKRRSLIEKERINKNITVDNTRTTTSRKIVKKDKPERVPVVTKMPETRRKVTETLIRKEKLDTDVKAITKKKTEYNARITNKAPGIIPKVSAHIEVTPKKQGNKVEKTERVVLTKRITRPDDKKPASKVVTSPLKKQPSGKSKPNEVKQLQSTTVEVVPAKRHVVSTIINIKPKQRPETITKTIHKTTVTRTITAPKSIKPTSVPKVPKTKPVKPIVNGHDVSTEEDNSDIDDVKAVEDLKPRQRDQSKPVEKKKKCITTKSIVIENAVADQREIIVDLKRSKSSREATPDRICPFPISGDTDTSVPRYPDRVTEPEDATHPPHKPKKIADVPLNEDEDVVEEFERITEIRNREMERTDECLLSVNEKVSKFLSTAEKVTKKPLDGKPAPKVDRPTLDVEESLREDECLLSVSDKVNKFITTAEQLSSKNTTVRYKTPNESTPTYPDKRASSPQKTFPDDSAKYKTPERKPSDLYVRRTTDVEESTLQIKRQSLGDDTPKSSRRRPSEDEPTGRLRSTETITKAKAVFENTGRESPVIPRQRDILSRPSVFEGRKLSQRTDETRNRTSERREDVMRRSISPEKYEMPHYMLPLDRTVREHGREKDDESEYRDDESVYSRGTTPDGNIPHYMLPLDRSLRERSPHKENVRELEDIMNRSLTHSGDEADAKPTKFGVTLKQTDSGRKVTPTAASAETPGRSSLDSLEIEEIFDLEYLEKLLETVVGYDIRRRIRTQIRLIKRIIEERTVETVRISHRESPTKETHRTDREHSPSKRVDKRQEIVEKQVTEHHTTSSTTYQRKASSTEQHIVKTKSPSPTRVKKDRSPDKSTIRIAAKSPSPVSKARSPVKDTPFDDTKVSTTSTTTSRRLFQTDLKKMKQPTTKIVAEEKPEWVTQRTTLRKVTETSAPIRKTVATTVTQKSRVVRREEQQPTDVIISSYGVGPTDEDGTPLFGLKALKARNKSEKTKVQGTVIRSQFYSENGAEPEGEISVTEFSTDPDDLKAGTPITREKGITSVTTTQKFGYKGSPPLKTLTGKDKQQPSENTQRKSSATIGKVTRRGSVKEISQKFIENAVDSLKNERQSSYPKAGLILRTSSFKDSPSTNGESREDSTASQELHRKTTTTTTDGQRETFLTDKSKVRGVQDVISRMKNEALAQYEDTEEDTEARNLLNKFIGSQVLLSGMESHVRSPSSQHDDGEGNVQRTIKITTTTTTSGSSKPTTVTRTFTHPITEELLQTVWDEQTLKLLLEQSTDYEDRRLIRARLREVMAEQEACAELVEKASDETAMKESGSTVHDAGVARTDSETDEEEEDEDEEEEDSNDDDKKRQQQQQQQPDLIMQTNPLYNKLNNQSATYDDNNNKDNEDNNIKNENDDYPAHLNERANRFNNKKLKMKRANTIDIPKPLKYYECDDEDSDNDETGNNNRRNSYLALRGPIRVGKISSEQKKVPEFQPKTDSDKKFAAFLRNNTNNNNNSGTNEYSRNNKPSSIWSNNFQPGNKSGNVTSNWSNKFGNIKNNFEKIQTSNTINSARNFWKSADDAVTAGRSIYVGPKISRQSAKNLQQMFEEKQKEREGNVVTGQLTVVQPNAINKFSHAPLSAFKPVQKKVEVQTIQIPNRNKHSEAPLYLYSPKQLSPVNGPPIIPWNTGRTGGESRVLSIAASKFQNLPPEKSDPPAFMPRRLSKEKIIIPQQEKPHAPYSIINNNSVRKLSGQYDNLGNKAPNPAERRLFVPGENYTIKYDNPPQPRIYNADYTLTQQCYKVPLVSDQPREETASGSEAQIHNEKQQEMYSRIQEVEDPQHHQYRSEDQSDCERKTFNYERQTSQESLKEYTAVSSKVMSGPVSQQAVMVQQNAPKSRDQHDMEFNLKATLQKFSSQSVDYFDQKTTTLDEGSSLALSPKKSPERTALVMSPRKSPERLLEMSPKKSPERSLVTSPKKLPEKPLATNPKKSPESSSVVTSTKKSPESISLVTSTKKSPESISLVTSPKKLPESASLVMNPKQSRERIGTRENYRDYKEPPAPLVVYNNVKPRPSLRVNDRPLESLEINERGESVLTGKFHIPAEIRSPPIALSKSESWHQICRAVGAQPTPNKPSPSSRPVTRSKSSHTLALPKQFEAGMSKVEMLEKRKTMEAYFGLSKSETTAKKAGSSSINRVKTSQKISTQRQNSTGGISGGLCRSKTLPDIVCSDKLDDNSIDALFEDLFINSTFTSRTTTSSEGPVTTTPQVAARGAAQEQIKKPMSPFAKFRQLDKQNSLNSPPSTPKSPTGGSPLFKFTDPSLNQSANTVKQRLLQWCQMKTKEYENIQLDNFSTSWSDGMAFCALIHHFLPDAFDYSKLNPKNRRHNFTLAFRVADEKAGIAPLLDVDDMVAISRPDWKCVFTYVQSVYRRFKDED